MSRKEQSKHKFYDEVARRGGRCLAPHIADRFRVLIQCAEGHEWKAYPSNTKRGVWCPACAGNAPEQGFDQLIDLIEKKGGQLLSPYVNNRKKFLLRCSKGHEWKTVSCNIRRGAWCPACAGNCSKQVSNRIEEIVQKNDGQLIIPYVNSYTKVVVQCVNGHRFERMPYQLQDGKWCEECLD